MSDAELNGVLTKQPPPEYVSNANFSIYKPPKMLHLNRKRALWEALSDEERIRATDTISTGITSLSCDSGWQFDAQKVHKLCADYPEVAVDLGAVAIDALGAVATDNNVGEVVKRATEIFKYAVSSLDELGYFYELPVTFMKDAAMAMKRKSRGTGAMPLQVFMMTIHHFASSMTQTPPPRNSPSRRLWTLVKQWNARVDCLWVQEYLEEVGNCLPN